MFNQTIHGDKITYKLQLPKAVKICKITEKTTGQLHSSNKEPHNMNVDKRSYPGARQLMNITAKM